MKTKITDRTDRWFGGSSFSTRKPNENGYVSIDGYVDSPQGVVGVLYSENPKASSPGFRAGGILRVIANGTRHTRHFSGKKYTDRGLITLARRYARETADA